MRLIKSLFQKNRYISSQFIGVSRQSFRNYSSEKVESFEEFTTRTNTKSYENELDAAYDSFEVQRVLNNCFSYDLVPAPSVIEKGLRACRRVNDFPIAVRMLEALRHKVETAEQYQAYMDELSDVRKELGISLKEELFPEKL